MAKDKKSRPSRRFPPMETLKTPTKNISFNGTMQEIPRTTQRAGKFAFPNKKSYHGTHLALEGERSNMSVNSRNVMYTYEFVLKCSERMWDDMTC